MGTPANKKVKNKIPIKVSTETTPSDFQGSSHFGPIRPLEDPVPKPYFRSASKGGLDFRNQSIFIALRNFLALLRVNEKVHLAK